MVCLVQHRMDDRNGLTEIALQQYSNWGNAVVKKLALKIQFLYLVLNTDTKKKKIHSRLKMPWNIFIRKVLLPWTNQFRFILTLKKNIKKFPKSKLEFAVNWTLRWIHVNGLLCQRRPSAISQIFNYSRIRFWAHNLPCVSFAASDHFLSLNLEWKKNFILYYQINIENFI